MKKNFLVIFFLIFSSILPLNAEEKLKIYSRVEWGADEKYRYQDSKYWKNIISERRKADLVWKKKWESFSQNKKDEIIADNKKKLEKKKKMNAYLVNNFGKYIKVVEYHKYEGKNKLAWGISKTNYVKNIVIHHTYSEYKDSFNGIKKIYKYHSLNREWGDIGYHYIIGYNGEIFEGRAGGDYVVAAHDTWNNYGTVGISIMGNYEKRELTEEQYRSLKKLVSYLAKKYGINMNNKIPYHKECFGKDCENGLKTNYFYPIVGHRDGKGTACPGKNIYNKVIPKLINELKEETKGYKLISYLEVKDKETKFENKLNKYNWNKLKNIFNKFSNERKVIFFNKINKLLSDANLDWKKRMLCVKIIKELKK